jgi:hypothetical protein
MVRAACDARWIFGFDQRTGTVCHSGAVKLVNGHRLEKYIKGESTLGGETGSAPSGNQHSQTLIIGNLVSAGSLPIKSANETTFGAMSTDSNAPVTPCNADRSFSCPPRTQVKARKPACR